MLRSPSMLYCIDIRVFFVCRKLILVASAWLEQAITISEPIARSFIAEMYAMRNRRRGGDIVF